MPAEGAARRGAAGLLAALLLWLAAAAPAAAHDIPAEMRAHAFARVQGGELHVLLRLPLSLLLNVDLPKQGPGYLALAHIDDGLARAVAAADRQIVWHADGRRLVLAGSRARISLPSDTSFERYESAAALIAGPPLPASNYVFWNQGWFDAHLRYALDDPAAPLALDFQVAPGLRDRLKLDLRFITAAGAERAYALAAADGPVDIDPRWHRAARTFLVSGFEHILVGTDHLLFLAMLLLPFRRIDLHLVGVVTAFTLAHSVTLIGAAYGLAPEGDWFAPAVETLIALSILAMALENVLRTRPQGRWLTSAAFGLVHGFGFASVLQAQLQFAGDSLLVSLLAFNVGVELGQLLVLLALLPLLAAARARWPAQARALDLVACALAAHAAWHWLAERAPAWWRAAELGLHPGVALAVLLALAAAGLLLHRRSGNGRPEPAGAAPVGEPAAAVTGQATPQALRRRAR